MRLALCVYMDEEDRDGVAQALKDLRDQGRDIWWANDDSASMQEIHGKRVQVDMKNALEEIAYHPQAYRDFRGNEDPRDWKWEAESMRAIALAAYKAAKRIRDYESEER